MCCDLGVTAAGGTPAVLQMATGGQAGASDSLPGMTREKRAGNRDESEHGFVRDESGQSGQLHL